MIIFPKSSLAKYVFQYVTVQTFQILFHFKRPGFGFQIFFLVNDVLNGAWDLAIASWSAEAASPVILMLLKPNFLLKLSKQTWLAFSSPLLDPSPSFCFKLSYSDFAFSQILLESIAPT